MSSTASTSHDRSGSSSRQNEMVYLIGHMSHQITGSKLKSNCQVLRSLFYNIRQVKLNTREAARLTIQEVVIFWEKAKIPTRHFKVKRLLPKNCLYCWIDVVFQIETQFE